jgi:hypothetical protein
VYSRERAGERVYSNPRRETSEHVPAAPLPSPLP